MVWQTVKRFVEFSVLRYFTDVDPDRRGGRSASYRLTVQSNGNLLIGSAYTKQLDLKPGDEFEINLGRKHIRLKQVE